jgi:hypothetical protein
LRNVLHSFAKNSNGSMLHCGSAGWGKLIGKMDVPDSRYLARKATQG